MGEGERSESSPLKRIENIKNLLLPTEEKMSKTTLFSSNIPNIQGPLTGFKPDENGNFTIPYTYWEVNGTRMSDEEYRAWQERRNGDVCESIGQTRDCIESLENAIKK